MAGLAKLFSVEDLVGKQGTFVANLPPRSMMGMESEGMMLIAKDTQGNAALVAPTVKVENGTRLS